MIRFLVSLSEKERKSFINERKEKGLKLIAIYNDSLDGLKDCFDFHFKLSDLYKDDVFLNLLAKIDNNTIVFLIDLGIHYCSWKADYIKPYTKLSPICKQAKTTYIIDGFAFYNTEKAIYRPFLYIDDKILDTNINEFYNVGEIYKDFNGNQIENYYSKIKPYIQFNVKPLAVEVVKYTPSEAELKDYEELKFDVIKIKKYPKVKIINLLLDFINNTASKKEAMTQNCLKQNANTLIVEKNSNNSRIKMYKEILRQKPSKLIFYSSGIYGVDEMELDKTKNAIIRHNKLGELLND